MERTLLEFNSLDFHSCPRGAQEVQAKRVPKDDLYDEPGHTVLAYRCVHFGTRDSPR